jgi:CubicO group peptidase (beta-lactamase class C family)
MTLGSTSKAITAAAVGLLMDDFAHGRNKVPLPHGVKNFTWNTPMKYLLPGEWKLLDPKASNEATMADLLSHSSGLPRHALTSISKMRSY